MAYISGAVEGMPDEAVLRRIVIARRAEVHRIQVRRGKANLRRALPGYNAAAQGDPWLVLVDLDRDFDCAAALVADWLPAPSAANGAVMPMPRPAATYPVTVEE